MKTSPFGISLIKFFEGVKLKAYLDSAGIPTIGVGTIVYPNGKKVQMGDVITMQQAEEYLAHHLKVFEYEVNKLVKTRLTQNQFDALISFTYNLGSTNLRSSTLLKKININPSDPSIKDEFLKWTKAGVEKKIIQGLLIRRQKESELYFKL